MDTCQFETPSGSNHLETVSISFPLFLLLLLFVCLCVLTVILTVFLTLFANNGYGNAIPVQMFNLQVTVAAIFYCSYISKRFLYYLILYCFELY